MGARSGGGAKALLLAYLHQFRSQHGVRASQAVTLIGVDIDEQSRQMARASLLLAGADPNQFWIFAGNSLAQPIAGRDRRTKELRTLEFSITLANPPFGQKTELSWLADAAKNGPLEIPGHVLNRTIPRVGASPAGAVRSGSDGPKSTSRRPRQRPRTPRSSKAA